VPFEPRVDRFTRVGTEIADLVHRTRSRSRANH
jgi:hypothetical protein